MDRNLANRFACTICGTESRRHAGWYLVVENQWLDRVKILAWHPVLARQTNMQSVCSGDHLKTLLTHWLNFANLRVLSGGITGKPGSVDEGQSEPDPLIASVGRLVGELAVHRESLSRMWTGSPQAFECILNALVGRIAVESSAPTLTAAPVALEREYASARAGA